jgi:WD40 repeat protein
MYSGGQDTYIVVYDLASDQAQYKLMGHKENITQISLFSMENPYLKGRVQKILVSSSKDGFLKFWDLE